MQLFLMIELALMLLFVVKVGIRNAEQELRRKPFRYGHRLSDRRARVAATSSKNSAAGIR
jgi:hypothetical protein